jgi:uncharacterized protein (DUF1778 family)
VPQRQINIRLVDDSVKVLEAAAYIEGGLSVAEYVRPMLDQLVAELVEDPAVQTAMRLQAERVAKREGKLTDIGSRRNRGDAG